jgi:hypothetical protein
MPTPTHDTEAFQLHSSHLPMTRKHYAQAQLIQKKKNAAKWYRVCCYWSHPLCSKSKQSNDAEHYAKQELIVATENWF